jgi:hypothetical protein
MIEEWRIEGIDECSTPPAEDSVRQSSIVNDGFNRQ